MTRLIFCYRHVCCSFPSYPSDAPGSLCALRAIPLVFERERFPVLWFVLIRALRRCEYVYKMLTTVSLSVTSDPVTSRSSTDTVPVSSFRLHVESDPGPVNRSTTRPKAVCQPKSTNHVGVHSHRNFFYLRKWVFMFCNGRSIFH